MAYETLIDVLMPCLGRRKSGATYGKDNRVATPTGKQPVRPKFEDGLELASTPKRTKSFSSYISSSSHGVTTTIVAELPTQPSPTRSTRLRSLSTKTTRSKKNGTRKRTQPLKISAPMNFRHVNGENSSNSTFTYPSPSRTRPWNLATGTSQSTSDDEKRPRTAPSPSSEQKQSSIPHRSGSLPLRSQSSKLTALPPVPPLNLEKRKDKLPQGKGSLKRKPVPIRTRAASNPTSPTYIPQNFAAEMLGSVPSPVELEAPDAFRINLVNGHKNQGNNKSIASISSLPSPGRFSDRLSVGALNLLSNFPIIPKLGKADSSSTATQTKPKTQPPKKSELDGNILTALPQAKTRARGESSPSTASPRTPLPGLPLTRLPPTDPRPFLQKSLPPTPQSSSFEKVNFFSVRPGSISEEMSATALTPTSMMGKKPWIEAVGLGSDTESIEIFLASSIAGSPRI